MCEENAQPQPCDMPKEDADWKTARQEVLNRRIRKPTNCEYICELADELMKLDMDYKRLETAIKADPSYVPDSQKALWPEQLKAMGDYKTALKKRIIDLINTDN